MDLQKKVIDPGQSGPKNFAISQFFVARKKPHNLVTCYIHDGFSQKSIMYITSD